MTDITVLIPIGPNPANQRWIQQCVDSVYAQTHPVHDILLIDDMAGVKPTFVQFGTYTLWKSPWYLGVAHAFNIGVALASTEWVFMLGSDDWLEPDCIQKCVDELAKMRDPLGYYFTGVRYSDTGETQDLACHAAMVSKALWRRTGGFPIQSASGAPDSALLSIMIGNYPHAGRFWKVADGVPLYNYRRHDETDTVSKGSWQGVILETRDLVTREWQPRDGYVRE
jgi:glycosyltransferase involved in cell wall biosynthesis